jgi:hypothetical protein
VEDWHGASASRVEQRHEEEQDALVVHEEGKAKEDLTSTMVS